MKRRADREIEIFSLSAIDLFAAAMGAFALLTIVLMPYYQKEVRERTPQNAIADLARAAQQSAEQSTIKRKALEAKRSAAAASVSALKSQAQKLLARLRGAEAALKDKQARARAAAAVPEPVAQKPGQGSGKALVTFRFLGLKTTQNDIVVALDMNRCLKGHDASIKRAVHRIIDSLQPNHRLLVAGFQQTDSGPHIYTWPQNGSLRPFSAQTRTAAEAFADGLTRRFGGSSSMLDVFRRLVSGPGGAIFLVSDGLPNPRANNGLSPAQLVRAITRLNGGRKEIHTIVVGNYFDYDGTVDFMESLAQANKGQFMALASPNPGVCN